MRTGKHAMAMYLELVLMLYTENKLDATSDYSDLRVRNAFPDPIPNDVYYKRRVGCLPDQQSAASSITMPHS